MDGSGSRQARVGVDGWTLLDGAAGSRAGRAAVGIAAFVVATAISAYVTVPWTPVPMTLQPLVVLLAGALLGPWAGASAMAVYLAVGASGAPVFSAGHGGFAWLLGPTGGYLFAFPAAAATVGVLAGDGTGPRNAVIDTGRLLFALLAGVVVLYAGGVAQLAVLTGQDLAALLEVGVLPFLLGDLTKALIALFLVLAVRRTREGKSPGGH